MPSATLQAGDLAAALDWWRDAGVDLHYDDAPRSWLAKDEPVATAAPVQHAPPPPPEPARIMAKNADLPATLDLFREWWLTDPALDGAAVERRVPPRGPAHAPLMVLVTEPESQDRERLLSGPQGMLLDAMLTALGIAPDSTYVASCLPRHMPLPDWAALQAAGLGEVVAHHVALAAPQRLLVLGNNISSLLGHDPAKTDNSFTHFNHGGAMWRPRTATMPARSSRTWPRI